MKRFGVLLVLIPLAAHAATITVTTTSDNITAGDGHCTLREAIANVNAAGDTTGGDCTAGSGTGDTIKFDIAMPAKIRLKLGELLIQRDVSIENPAPGSLHIDGFGRSRVLEIAAGTTSMGGMTIERGNAVGGDGGGVMVNVGAALSLANSTVVRNVARYDFDSESGGTGGGIYNAGMLSLSSCAVVRNTATAGSESTGGGGIENDGGTATLTNSTITGNQAKGGAAFVYGGGGINNYDGTLTLSGCTVEGNRVTGGWNDTEGTLGGGIDNEIGTVFLSDCTLAKNMVVSGLDGFSQGGGIYNDGGTVTVTRCTLRRNTTLIHGEGGSYGGGIDNEGSMTVTNSTFSRNATRSGENGDSSGGAVYNSASLSMTNCTLTGNRVSSCDAIQSCNASGGAIFTDGHVTLVNCTLSGNTAQRPNEEGGGGGAIAGGNATLTNTIVAHSGAAGNCNAPVSSVGNNLSSDSTCFASGGNDLVNTAPRLAPLRNYGGATQTLALCTGPGQPVTSCPAASPAIDAGDDSVTGPPDNVTTDQRGLPRLSGAHVDIGAYEVQ